MKRALTALAVAVTITNGTPIGCNVPLPRDTAPDPANPAAQWVACVEAVHRDPAGDDAAYQACDDAYGIRTMPNGELAQ